MMKIASALLSCLLLAASARSAPVAEPAPKAPDKPFEAEIRAFERADARKMPPANAVLFLGSSSIQKWKDVARDIPEYTVINRGFGGSIIEQSTMYTPRIVWPYQPRLIVFYAGDNDLAGGKSPEQVLADFQAFTSKVREKLPTASIAFVSIKPSPSRAGIQAKAIKANALIREHIEARREARLRYIDVWTPMTDDSGNARPELFGPDKLHMNATGYALWTAIITPHLHAILGEPRPKAAPPEASTAAAQPAAEPAAEPAASKPAN